MFFNRSSAQKTARKLKKIGFKANQIDASHLTTTYSQLKQVPGRANFEGMTNAINSLDPIPKQVDIPCLGVIIETREHPLLVTVVLDFIKKTQYPVQIYHGNLNVEFILSSKIAGLVEEGKVILTSIEVDHLDAGGYNALVLSKEFWYSLISHKKIFIFQTDSILCKRSKYSLTDFISYDYIGSQWPRNRPIGLVIDGGNGGLSIRDWDRSIECLERFPPNKWTGGEDSYYAFHMDLIGAKVARDVKSGKFSTQYKYSYKSFGCHKVSCLSKKDKLAFVKFCPEARELL
jgi:hypothetical protein